MNRLSVWGKSEKIARKKSSRDFFKASGLWERGAKRCKHAEKNSEGFGHGARAKEQPSLQSSCHPSYFFTLSNSHTTIRGIEW